jgi:hypothetical protein
MIKLSQIKEALEDVEMQKSCYFNKKTSEILWSLEYNKEYSTYKETDEYNDDIISMFNMFTKNDYNIMRKFINTIASDSISNELYIATKGKGSFGKFRNIIDFYGITHDWYKYRDEEYKNIAKNWCQDNNIEFEEDC